MREFHVKFHEKDIIFSSEIYRCIGCCPIFCSIITAAFLAFKGAHMYKRGILKPFGFHVERAGRDSTVSGTKEECT